MYKLDKTVELPAPCTGKSSPTPSPYASIVVLKLNQVAGLLLHRLSALDFHLSSGYICDTSGELAAVEQWSSVARLA